MQLAAMEDARRKEVTRYEQRIAGLQSEAGISLLSLSLCEDTAPNLVFLPRHLTPPFSRFRFVHVHERGSACAIAGLSVSPFMTALLGCVRARRIGGWLDEPVCVCVCLSVSVLCVCVRWPDEPLLSLSLSVVCVCGGRMALSLSLCVVCVCVVAG